MGLDYENEKAIVSILLKKGMKKLKEPRTVIQFTSDTDANLLLNDIEKHPHIFFLGCVMDRRITAEKAWLIPYQISQKLNDISFSSFLSLSSQDILMLFEKEKYHRYPSTMAKCFYEAINRIHTVHDDNVSTIWNGTPSSAYVVNQFLEFHGIGIKIASMAANILVRGFKIPMTDYMNIDLSPDTHVKRVFERIGFIKPDVSKDILLLRARELNPTYPGVFDYSCFTIGRDYCRPDRPNCGDCYISEFCPKIGITID